MDGADFPRFRLLRDLLLYLELRARKGNAQRDRIYDAHQDSYGCTSRRLRGWRIVDRAHDCRYRHCDVGRMDFSDGHREEGWMISFALFNPEIIIEATGVCDRACAGCYAPNLVSTQTPQQLYQAYPELFLKPELLKRTLERIGGSGFSLISIRGGEPTRHPDLEELLLIAAQFANSVVLETHGRWLLLDQIARSEPLLDVIRRSRAHVKLSFDRMHGLGIEDLHFITDVLSWHGINYRVAITEKNEEEFLKIRRLCSWLRDEDIIYQKKAVALSELPTPSVGVVGLDGTLRRTLAVRDSFNSVPLRSLAI